MDFPDADALAPFLPWTTGSPGVGALPRFAGVPTVVVARALYRAWLERAPRWRPFVHIDPAHCPQGGPDWVKSEPFAVAAGGWLYIGPGPCALWDPAALEELSARHALRIVTESDELLPLRPRLRAWLLRRDPFHLLASDPSMARLRRAALAYCRAQLVLHLSGPPGSGKRSLARWAHASLGQTPLETVRQGGGDRISPHGWQLYEEIAQLSPEQLVPLRDRLQAEEGGGGWDEAWHDAPERPEDGAFDPIVGDSPAMCRVLAKAARYARSRLPMLVYGETGTGKELFARAIHEASGRTGPFVAIDLNTRNVGLLESALFGHAKGAFTGAAAPRQGAAVQADRGTLFLDELGNLSLSTQAKLLRLLEQHTVQPLGSDRSIEVDLRIVAATNANLEELVRAGDFREDLLYRFNPSAVCRLPALRERPEDIAALAAHFLSGTGKSLGAEALLRLEEWNWPGNVRELRHTVEAAAIECPEAQIGPAHLGPLRAGSASAPVLVTSSEAREERAAQWCLNKTEIQKVVAVTLQVPPLAERGSACLRNAILGSLGGRPVSQQVLRALERRTWWGNFTELSRELTAVCSNLEGPIDLVGLHRTLPDLLRDPGQAPIKILLFPSSHHGEIVGLEQEFKQAAVVVGRTTSLDDLRPRGSAADKKRLQKRWDMLEEMLGTRSVGFLNLSFLSRISRAHFVLCREQGSLLVHTLPGTRLPVSATSLPSTGLFPVKPGSPVDIGQAGEIQIADTKGRLYFQLYVFTGNSALSEFGAGLAEHLAGPADKTLGYGELKRQVWKLRADEVEALSELVIRAQSRPHPFARGLREAAREWKRQSPELGALAEYLDSAHPTQSCTRLVTFDANVELRSALERLLSGEEFGRELWAQLPAGIRRALTAPG